MSRWHRPISLPRAMVMWFHGCCWRGHSIRQCSVVSTCSHSHWLVFVSSHILKWWTWAVMQAVGQASTIGVLSISVQPFEIIWMILGRIIEQVNGECRIQEWDYDSACLHFLFMSPDPYFSSFWFQEHNSTTVRNILMVFGRIIEQVNVECPIHEWQLANFCF